MSIFDQQRASAIVREHDIIKQRAKYAIENLRQVVNQSMEFSAFMRKDPNNEFSDLAMNNNPSLSNILNNNGNQ